METFEFWPSSVSSGYKIENCIKKVPPVKELNAVLFCQRYTPIKESNWQRQKLNSLRNSAITSKKIAKTFPWISLSIYLPFKDIWVGLFPWIRNLFGIACWLNAQLIIRNPWRKVERCLFELIFWGLVTEDKFHSPSWLTWDTSKQLNGMSKAMDCMYTFQYVPFQFRNQSMLLITRMPAGNGSIWSAFEGWKEVSLDCWDEIEGREQKSDLPAALGQKQEVAYIVLVCQKPA